MQRIQSRRVVHCILAISTIVLLAGCGGGGGGGGSSDTTAPVPGTGLAASDVTASTLTMTWGAASDLATSSDDLAYALYYSTSNNLGTVSNAEHNGTPVFNGLQGITTKDVTGLSDGITYYFALVVADAAGNKSLYPNIPVTMGHDPTVPSAGQPITFSAVGTTSITVNWEAATDAETPQNDLQYMLLYSTSNNLDTVADAHANGTEAMGWTTAGLTHQVNGLSPHITYYFTVIVKDGANNEALYTPQPQQTLADTTDPTAGTGLVFSGVSATGMTVSWGAASDDITDPEALEYQLVYSTSNNLGTVEDAEANGTISMNWTADTTTKAVTGLSEATLYYFAALVKDGAGNITLYQPDSKKTLDVTPPEAGTDISFTNRTSTSATVSWGAATDNGSAPGNLVYKLYWSLSNNMDTVENTEAHGTSIGQWAGVTSHDVDSLSSSTTYYFAVIVLDEGGNKSLYTQQSVITEDPAWQTMGTEGFSAGSALYTSLKVDPDGVPYVAYRDGANGNRLTVMKFNGTTWLTVGTLGFSSGPASYVSLALDTDGVPYVAYSDYDSDLAIYRLTVKKFNGVSWDTLGTERFSAGQPRYISLCIDPVDSIPYVAYQDASKTSKLVVQRYVSEAWQAVGSADGISTGGAVFTSLRIDSTGIPYVAYADLATNDVSVMYYSGSWSSVGVPDFTAGNVLQQPLSLCLDADDVPYVAYSDETLGKALLMKYETGSWSPVGSGLGFSTGEAEFVSLGFGLNGEPYVAYRDDSQSGKAMLMKYASSAWSAVGTDTGFSATGADFTSLGFDQLGNPVVGYVDENSANKATVRKFF